MIKPRFTIFAKFFVTILLGSMMVAVILMTSVHLSFKQGFNHYLMQAELTQLDKLSDLLVDAYAKQGNWSFLQNDPFSWQDFLRQGLDKQHLPPKNNGEPVDEDPGHPPPGFPPPLLDSGTRPDHGPGFEFRHDHGPGHGPHRGPPPAHNKAQLLARFLGSRIELLDNAQHRLAGIKEHSGSGRMRPLYYQQQVIGWLYVEPGDVIADHLAQLFVQQQLLNNMLIAALTLVLAILLAWIISKKMLMPLKKLSRAAQLWVKGQYQHQINLNTQDELGQLANNFNHLARTLKANEDARKRWIADISHELRTPLAVLRGEIEAVQDGVRDFSVESLKSLHAEVMSLNRLVDDLYELSLSDMGSTHLQKHPVNLCAILRDVLQNQESRFQDQDLKLIGKIQTDDCRILGDARRLHQLFANLCENSKRYTSLGGWCEVNLSVQNGSIVIRFQDSPPGVPDHALPKLFDRLYRLDASRNRESGGAGLGLAICAAIVQAHDGEIHAFHSEYGGLGISIRLPLYAGS